MSEFDMSIHVTVSRDEYRLLMKLAAANNTTIDMLARELVRRGFNSARSVGPAKQPPVTPQPPRVEPVPPAPPVVAVMRPSRRGLPPSRTMTADDLRQLRELRAIGCSDGEIAAALDFSITTVGAQRRRLGLAARHGRRPAAVLRAVREALASRPQRDSLSA